MYRRPSCLIWSGSGGVSGGGGWRALLLRRLRFKDRLELGFLFHPLLLLLDLALPGVWFFACYIALWYELGFVSKASKVKIGIFRPSVSNGLTRQTNQAISKGTKIPFLRMTSSAIACRSIEASRSWPSDLLCSSVRLISNNIDSFTSIFFFQERHLYKCYLPSPRLPSIPQTWSTLNIYYQYNIINCGRFLGIIKHIDLLLAA